MKYGRYIKAGRQMTERGVTDPEILIKWSGNTNVWDAVLPWREISVEKNKSFAASSSNSHHRSLLHCQYRQEWRKILEKTCQSAPPTLVCVSCNFRQQLQRRGLTGLTVYRHHHLWTVDRHWQRLLWYRPFSTVSDAEPDTGRGQEGGKQARALNSP